MAGGQKPPRESVEDEMIQKVDEVELGDLGVSSGFVKQVLQGKEIMFVIGRPIHDFLKMICEKLV